MTIENNIILKRPNIKQSSLYTYMVSLKSLRKQIDNSTDMNSTDFLQNYDKVMESIKDMKITTKKK